MKNPLVDACAVRVKDWCMGKGLALKTVAAKTGLSMAILYEWEHGHQFPSVDHLWAVAQYTGIPAWELIQPVKGGQAKKSRVR